MSISAGTVHVDVKPDLSSITGTGSGSIVGSMAKAGALAGAALATSVGVAVGKFAVDAVSAAIESEKMMKSTKAVIDSMGIASQVSAKHVADLSSKIMGVTAIDDEVIQSGVNLLLTFKNVIPVLDEATGLTVDFAARFGTDIPGAAKLVGKALNDPIKGLASLGRVGVQFSETQKKQIERFVETNDLAGAQGIIMKELSKETKGAAKSQANSMDLLKMKFGEFQEGIGKALLPSVKMAARAIGRFVESKEFQAWLKDAQKWIKKTAKEVQQFAKSKEFQAWLRDAATVMKALIPVIVWVGKVFVTDLANRIKAVITVSKTAMNVFAAVKSAIVGVWNAIRSAWQAAPAFFSGIWNGIVSGASGIWTTIVGFFNTGIAAIKAAMNSLISAFNSSLEISFGGITIGGKTLGAFSIDPPDIPSLAGGGVVTQPTLAMIGEAGPEAVVPLNQMASLKGVVIEIRDHEYGRIARGEIVAERRYEEARERARR
jgi:phage-related protein